MIATTEKKKPVYYATIEREEYAIDWEGKVVDGDGRVMFETGPCGDSEVAKYLIQQWIMKASKGMQFGFAILWR